MARVDGALVPYDVSHQLKLPTSPVLPGLNPVPDLRFLAAAGKGLVFSVSDGLFHLVHFAKFVWLNEDGGEHHPAHALLLNAKAPGADRDGSDGRAC